MSSGIQSIVQLQLLNNIVSLSGIAIVAYDYVLTFPTEVEYIWSKPWTWLSTLFLIVRYVGIFSVVSVALTGSTFVPGPLKTCIGLVYSRDWALTVFICASDLFLVLRVYAMWNRSKIILSILLLGYTVQVILQVVLCAVFHNPYIDATVAISKVLDYSVCTEVYAAIGSYFKYMVIYPMLFDFLLLILALIPTVKESTAMYKATKRWQLNQYMSLIVKEGVLYVLLNLLNNIANAMAYADEVSLLPVWYLISTFFYATITFPLIPRFVLSVREMYAKDTIRCYEGLDTGFGIPSRFGNVSRHDTGVSWIATADEYGSRPGEEGDEEIQLELVEGDGEVLV